MFGKRTIHMSKKMKHKDIKFENESAELLFQEIESHYPSLDLKGQPLSDMYYHAKGLQIPEINNKRYIPVYNIIAC